MTVLIVLTSHDTLGNTGRKTGVWLEEFLVPYYEFVEANMHVRIASPLGGEVPIDPLSVETIKHTDLYQRFERDEKLQAALKNTERLREVNPDTVDAVLYPGGHGPLFDLRTDTQSIRLIKAMYNAGKPIATICHSGCVLLDVKTPSGSPFVRGRKVTAFSDSEEAAVQLEKDVPYLVETELKSLGANYSKAGDWQEHCVVDDLLITGQNPASSAAVAKVVIDRLTATAKVTA
ncbi:dimethylallyltransferase [Burkholderia ubonensis]|uniref:type 1 glutamine amidotransferase domain-containing protein n=1 Tax=Burkholderia ubonensis TaxID=101571 RepID=UPI0007590A23|nr:type 1 glutamine amidotransferase domain-containing protein [Burkholderia ubonensis]KVX09153.1 dimethylallyltransferase [Burkholderia ubonensis]KWB38508.1 dimethylallyltransferase [Burkholderia ubonensis]KWC23336.1 dimethylallyltransferase [Burkholderia ubonensis]